TSGLILAPMLWELTLSFRVLAPSAAAAILAGYALAACALGWKHNLPAVFWVANATAAAGSLALLVAARQPEPFVAALLVLLAACEAASLAGRAARVRPMVAAAADL